MKLQFKHQKFQADATKAVVDVFAGQPYLTPTYMMDCGLEDGEQQAIATMDDFTGWRNERIVPELSDKLILEHLQKVQRTNQIKPSDKLEGRYNLTIEMETGVGKTYTYIKTMYELNKHYGWSKFIVVVPSIAIREGVYKSFQVTQEHFAEEYGKGTLSIEHIYDYLIVDEASQVDLATGVLAFSCARNIVIVGDLKQLPNVLTEDDIRTSDAIWQKYSLDERYRFSTHSLLSSALEIWQDAPVTLLREHYRCHPKIINFCNQKFYHGQLIVMTKDHDEPDVLTMYRTTAGNHARGHLNQRQIDVIQQEVLPRLHQQNFQSIGIITPYRDQVTAIRKQLGDTYEVDTVHKFQGREQDAIILTSVDNVITDFVDDPHMLNVAVSRAVHSLAVITSQDPRNDQTNYGDLARYIEYNNFEIIQSQIYSVFDMLYQGYAEQRREYLQKHKRVSEYDSENLMHSVIQEILSDEPFSSIGCAVHFSLATLVKDYAPLTEEERKYARNPLTHVDFLLFNQMDKQPVLAIEVDGGSHKSGSKQAERDAKKNSILDKCAIPLLRLRTDGSGEKEKIKNALKGE